MSGRYAKNLGTDWRMRSQGVSLAAEGLNTRGESYCADVQSDGFVPDAFLAALCGGKVDKRALAELIAAGWWQRVDGGHLIAAYTDRNGTRADAEAKARKNADRQARFRNASANAGGSEASNAPRNALRDASPSPSHQSQSSRSATHSDRARDGRVAILVAEMTTALGAVGGKFVPRSEDVAHLAEAAAAMAEADPRPLRDVAREWLPHFVAEFRSRTPKNLALYAQSRAANGGKAIASGKRDGWQPPADASAFEATEITDDLFKREAVS